MPEQTRAAVAAVRLQAAADEIAAEVRRLPPELITWIPAEGVWSVMDNLSHVREFVPFWTGETLRIVRRPHEQWGRDHTDTARLAAVTDTASYTLEDVLSDIRGAVRRSADTLNGLSDADLAVEATSRNPRWGLKPASFVVDHLLVQHVEKHLGQVRRNVTQYLEKGESVSAYLFSPPSPAAAPIRGRSERFPIRRIFCVGRNYEAHAREMGVAADREAPFYFTKAAEHSVASGSTVPYPPGTKNYHYELELVAAIGAPAFRVPADRALECVFGYACGLDMTRRDLQAAAKEKQRPWDIGKDVEQSAVLSEIVPAADIGHPSKGRIELRVNGETKQDSDLSLLIHGVPEVVAHLSTFYHLEPGDLIYTGTPEGVGPVKPGDKLEGSIAGVGTIALSIGAPV
jgi:fumarylpyruvate hydrolase